MNPWFVRAFGWVAVGCLASGTAAFAGLVDDFEDGNDTGWTRYAPLAAFGAGATVTYPEGWYRIQAGASPAPALLGPQRAGSIRVDQPYGRLRVAADITAWSVEVHQSVGVFGRLKDVGLGTTKGYTFNYNSQSGYFQLTRVTNESPERTVDESPWRLDPAGRYRMIFTAVGDLLLGQAFATTNLTVPVHSLFGQDAAYDTGSAGVFAFALNAGTGIDARFDNYEVGPAPEVVRATVLTVSPRPGEVPTVAVDSVTVKLADLETAIDPGSFRLEVDGAEVGPLDRVGSDRLTLLTWSPAEPLAVDRRHTVRLTFSDEQGPQAFVWSFGSGAEPGGGPELLGGSAPEGPFEVEAAATHDAGGRRFTVPVNGATRFYRLRDGVGRTLETIVVGGGQVVIGYR